MASKNDLLKKYKIQIETNFSDVKDQLSDLQTSLEKKYKGDLGKQIQGEMARMAQSIKDASESADKNFAKIQESIDSISSAKLKKQLDNLAAISKDCTDSMAKQVDFLQRSINSINGDKFSQFVVSMTKPLNDLRDSIDKATGAIKELNDIKIKGINSKEVKDSTDDVLSTLKEFIKEKNNIDKMLSEKDRRKVSSKEFQKGLEEEYVLVRALYSQLNQLSKVKQNIVFKNAKSILNFGEIKDAYEGLQSLLGIEEDIEKRVANVTSKTGSGRKNEYTIKLKFDIDPTKSIEDIDIDSWYASLEEAINKKLKNTKTSNVKEFKVPLGFDATGIKNKLNELVNDFNEKNANTIRPIRIKVEPTFEGFEDALFDASAKVNLSGGNINLDNNGVATEKTLSDIKGILEKSLGGKGGADSGKTLSATPLDRDKVNKMVDSYRDSTKVFKYIDGKMVEATDELASVAKVTKELTGKLQYNQSQINAAVDARRASRKGSGREDAIKASAFYKQTIKGTDKLLFDPEHRTRAEFDKFLAESEKDVVTKFFQDIVDNSRKTSKQITANLMHQGNEYEEVRDKKTGHYSYNLLYRNGSITGTTKDLNDEVAARVRAEDKLVEEKITKYSQYRSLLYEIRALSQDIEGGNDKSGKSSSRLTNIINSWENTQKEIGKIDPSLAYSNEAFEVAVDAFKKGNIKIDQFAKNIAKILPSGSNTISAMIADSESIIDGMYSTLSWHRRRVKKDAEKAGHPVSSNGKTITEARADKILNEIRQRSEAEKFAGGIFTAKNYKDAHFKSAQQFNEYAKNDERIDRDRKELERRRKEAAVYDKLYLASDIGLEKTVGRKKSSLSSYYDKETKFARGQSASKINNEKEIKVLQMRLDMVDRVRKTEEEINAEKNKGLTIDERANMLRDVAHGNVKKEDVGSTLDKALGTSRGEVDQTLGKLYKYELENIAKALSSTVPETKDEDAIKKEITSSAYNAFKEYVELLGGKIRETSKDLSEPGKVKEAFRRITAYNVEKEFYQSAMDSKNGFSPDEFYKKHVDRDMATVQAQQAESALTDYLNKLLKQKEPLSNEVQAKFVAEQDNLEKLINQRSNIDLAEQYIKMLGGKSNTKIQGFEVGEQAYIRTLLGGTYESVDAARKSLEDDINGSADVLNKFVKDSGDALRLNFEAVRVANDNLKFATEFEDLLTRSKEDGAATSSALINNQLKAVSDKVTSRTSVANTNLDMVKKEIASRKKAKETEEETNQQLKNRIKNNQEIIEKKQRQLEITKKQIEWAKGLSDDERKAAGIKMRNGGPTKSSYQSVMDAWTAEQKAKQAAEKKDADQKKQAAIAAQKLHQQAIEQVATTVKLDEAQKEYNKDVSKMERGSYYAGMTEEQAQVAKNLYDLSKKTKYFKEMTAEQTVEMGKLHDEAKALGLDINPKGFAFLKDFDKNNWFAAPWAYDTNSITHGFLSDAKETGAYVNTGLSLEETQLKILGVLQGKGGGAVRGGEKGKGASGTNEYKQRKQWNKDLKDPKKQKDAIISGLAAGNSKLYKSSKGNLFFASTDSTKDFKNATDVTVEYLKKYKDVIGNATKSQKEESDATKKVTVSKKQSSKKTSDTKSNNKFDRDAYLSIAKELGIIDKDATKVPKAERQKVYDEMKKRGLIGDNVESVKSEEKVNEVKKESIELTKEQIEWAKKLSNEEREAAGIRMRNGEPTKTSYQSIIDAWNAEQKANNAKEESIALTKEQIEWVKQLSKEQLKTYGIKMRGGEPTKNSYQNIVDTWNQGQNIDFSVYPKEIIKRYLDGVEAESEAEEEIFRRFGMVPRKTLEEQLKIGSPSKVMEELGMWTGEGFINGVEEKIPSVEEAAKRLVKAFMLECSESLTDAEGFLTELEGLYNGASFGKKSFAGQGAKRLIDNKDTLLSMIKQYQDGSLPEIQEALIKYRNENKKYLDDMAKAKKNQKYSDEEHEAAIKGFLDSGFILRKKTGKNAEKNTYYSPLLPGSERIGEKDIETTDALTKSLKNVTAAKKEDAKATEEVGKKTKVTAEAVNNLADSKVKEANTEAGARSALDKYGIPDGYTVVKSSTTKRNGGIYSASRIMETEDGRTVKQTAKYNTKDFGYDVTEEEITKYQDIKKRAIEATKEMYSEMTHIEEEYAGKSAEDIANALEEVIKEYSEKIAAIRGEAMQFAKDEGFYKEGVTEEQFDNALMGATSKSADSYASAKVERINAVYEEQIDIFKRVANAASAVNELEAKNVDGRYENQLEVAKEELANIVNEAYKAVDVLKDMLKNGEIDENAYNGAVGVFGGAFGADMSTAKVLDAEEAKMQEELRGQYKLTLSIINDYVNAVDRLNYIRAKNTKSGGKNAEELGEQEEYVNGRLDFVKNQEDILTGLRDMGVITADEFEDAMKRIGYAFDNLDGSAKVRDALNALDSKSIARYLSLLQEVKSGSKIWTDQANDVMQLVSMIGSLSEADAGEFMKKFASGSEDYMKDMVASASKYLDKLAGIQVAPNLTRDFKDKATAAFEELKNAIQDILNNGLDPSNYQEKISRLGKAISGATEIAKGKSDANNIAGNLKKLTSLRKQMRQEYDQNTAMPKDLRERYKAWLEEADAMRKLGKESKLTKADVDGLVQSAQDLGVEFADSGKSGMRFIDKIGQRLGDMNTKLIAQYLSWQDWIRYARTAMNTVIEIDSALTELRKVSDASNARLQQSFETSTKTAMALGSTITDVISVTADWARAGYNIADSEELARVTTLFTNVGDDMTAEDASSYLISSMKGFGLGIDGVEGIVDRYNEVALVKAKHIVICGV